MSISGSLFNAYSGLVAASRSAGAISQNVSNALTEGYGRREAELSAASLNGRGAGVRVAGIQRQTDQIAIADRRLAQAALGHRSALGSAFGRLESAIGVPGENGALTDMADAFEAALASAASRPDSQLRLQNVLYAASDLVGHINRISDEVQNLRMAADSEIARQVDTLNTTLSEVAELNRSIRLHVGKGRDINGLMDQRQVLVDRIADFLPIRTTQQEFGQITIATAGGAILLAGQPAEFGFTATGLITPDMTLASGALSGLQLNGKPIGIGSGTGLLEGGSLAAQFAIRDQHAPAAGAQIDALARNLIERFEDPALDPTLAPGDPGLFTDNAAALDISLETGLAERLRVNLAVDPDKGGALWRLRDGLGAAMPADPGDNTLLGAFRNTLTQGRVAMSGQYSASLNSFGATSGELTAANAGLRLNAEQSQAFARSRFQELKLIEAESGVDTDQEMQKLLLVEQAYAANARVISTLDQMLQTLLEI